MEMLAVLLVLAMSYLLYRYGVRLTVRAQLFGSALLEWAGYACSMGAGMALSLYGLLIGMDKLRMSLEAYGMELALLSTLVSILCGEYLHARVTRRCFQLLAPLRSEESER